MDNELGLILPYTHETLEVLHKGELEIRTESILRVNSEMDLKEHLAQIDKAMRFLHLVVTTHTAQNQSEQTLMPIGARLFNSTALALRDLLAGYYQGSIASIRDILEVGFLCDYFHHFPEKIVEWRNSDASLRRKSFSAFEIRKRLDSIDGFEGNKRGATYATLCEFGTHMTYPGLRTLNSSGPVSVGPFFDPRYLRGCLEELAKLGPSSVVHWQSNFDEFSGYCAIAYTDFMGSQGKWLEKYFGKVKSPSKAEQEAWQGRSLSELEEEVDHP